MEFVSGRHYMNRDGEQRHCIGPLPDGLWIFCGMKGGNQSTHHKDGRLCIGFSRISDQDIVSEWVEPRVEKRVLYLSKKKSSGYWCSLVEPGSTKPAYAVGSIAITVTEGVFAE